MFNFSSRPAQTGANLILAAGEGDRGRGRVGGDPTFLTAGSAICVPESDASLVYFPLTAILSVQMPLADGMWMQTAMIGNEGTSPIAIFHQCAPVLERIIVLVSGTALTLPTGAFERATAESGALSDAMHRFSYGLLLQTGQSSVCASRHTVEQRCARLLLSIHDRARVDEFELTHLALSRIMGVRRSSATIAAEALRAMGAIEYSRGKIRVTDRDRLRDVSCGCYDSLRDTYDRLKLFMPTWSGRDSGQSVS